MRKAFFGSLTMAAAVASTVLTSTTASADAVVPVPANAWVTINGHGYGHGHGMSQNGAQGAALRGLTAQQIVNFYYPGTAAGKAGGYVRVHITADDDNTTVVTARSGLTLRDLQANQSYRLPANGAKRWGMARTSDGRTKVSYLTTRWHGWKVLSGDGEFNAGGAPVALHTPDGAVQYRGRMQARRTDGKLVSVNVVSLQNYLKGVVPKEMPALWEPAAVQAQAIAARTYAAFERQHPLNEKYQICDTTSCQVYGGYSAEHPAANAAINATANKIQTHGGQPAFTQFSASSGGWTSAGSQPYLVAKADPYDGWSGNSSHSWSVRVDASQIERAYSGVGNLRGIHVTSRDGNGDWGGRVKSLTLTGTKNGSATRIVVSGSSFRSALGLKSDWLKFSAKAK